MPDDDQKRDEILKRMLNTPPIPHDELIEIKRSDRCTLGEEKIKEVRVREPKKPSST